MTNPYKTALLTIAVLTLVVGGLLFVATDTVVAAAASSALLSAGVLTMLLWLVVSALTWSSVEKPEQRRASEDNTAPTGSKLDQIRKALDES